ncbi:hypothetical protein T492DRAFT_958652 [Pavlovales sp. CCMP2436]|nr:hypothetical protein T492DRAFT_958652 [Pavlovales sp. CCMP2436]
MPRSWAGPLSRMASSDVEEEEEDAMMQLEGADVQAVLGRDVVRWLVGRGKPGAVRRQLSSHRHAELLATFNTMADMHAELPLAASKRVTLSRVELNNCLALLGIDGRLDAGESTEMGFEDFASMMLATDLLPVGRGDERESTGSLLENFPMMARAHDVRRTVTRAGAPPPPPLSTAEAGKPRRRSEVRRAPSHRRVESAQRMTSAEAASAPPSLSDVFELYEEVREVCSPERKWKEGKAPANDAGTRAGAAEAEAEVHADEERAEEERPHNGRRRVVGVPLPRSLAQLGTPAASAAARGVHAAGGLRASASTPVLALSAQYGRRANHLASTASLHSAAEGDDLLQPIHLARYTARSKVMPSLEKVDAGAGQSKLPLGAIEVARIRHIVPDQSRGIQSAKAGVQARMQAWHDLRQSGRHDGAARRDTMRMGRSLQERQRVYLGHTNPMPVADDGRFEFYS